MFLHRTPNIHEANRQCPGEADSAVGELYFLVQDSIKLLFLLTIPLHPLIINVTPGYQSLFGFFI
jgi:hypothetical protein